MTVILVQLSDTHVGPPGSSPYGIDTARRLRTVARAIRAMQLDPAAVLLTGDLSDGGAPESYRHLRDIVTDELEPLGCPILPVVGNHDHRRTFREVFVDEPNSDDATPRHYVVDLVNDGTRARIVMCDSYVAGTVSGRLGPAQLAWLAEQLASADGRTCVVALHHPAVPRGVPRADDYLLEDRAELEAIVAAHDVAAVLCGHSHVATASVFAGTLHAAAPSTAYRFDPSRRIGGRAVAGAGFAICTLRDGRAIVNPVLVDAADDVLYEF